LGGVDFNGVVTPILVGMVSADVIAALAAATGDELAPAGAVNKVVAASEAAIPLMQKAFLMDNISPPF
jgi:hypothetical protein